MSGWVKATDKNGKTIYVNIGAAISLQDADTSTRIVWSGASDNVKERPEDLLDASGEPCTPARERKVT